MITLYGYPRTRSLRVSWTLEELQLPYSYQLIDLKKAQHKQAEFLAINPFGKIPALADGDLVLTESAAICLYLAEKAGKLLPEKGSHASGLHHQWVNFIGNELEQPLWTMAKHRFALPEHLRHEAVIETAVWEFEQALATAEAWVPEQGYLLGDDFHIADILLTHTLNWAMTSEQRLPSKLAAYRKRVKSRPTMAKALEKELSHL
ncbi:glutathione S-transferase family protein [Corallincola spongiicola]|uniref:Glutathione S-transferase family protein n=1 Tax=Corallincola spongiicola TaxID=2520508 RepID=A0ABY1WNE5_9GAMM|nr:glutathione S-transferase family protein [Corallincola spongiicola]TAA45002.1 glutathione S-transferase family protein [Corallincola spongiicola]